MTKYQDIARLRTSSHDGRRNPIDAPLMRNTDLIGVIAEGEFAKLMELPFIGDAGPRGDGGIDFTLPSGTTIDIKGTENKRGNLLVPASARKKLVADIYVLAVVDCEKETATFVGWATHDEVVASPTKSFNNAYGDAYFVEKSKLHSMDEFYDLYSV